MVKAAYSRPIDDGVALLFEPNYEMLEPLGVSTLEAFVTCENGGGGPHQQLLRHYSLPGGWFKPGYYTHHKVSETVK